MATAKTKRKSRRHKPRQNYPRNSIKKHSFKKGRPPKSPYQDRANRSSNIGIEIECLPALYNLGKDSSSDAKQKKYTIIRKELKKLFKGSPVKIEVYDDKNSLVCDCKVWTLKDDPSIAEKASQGM
jgi:hypothetical protein